MPDEEYSDRQRRDDEDRDKRDGLSPAQRRSNDDACARLLRETLGNLGIDSSSFQGRTEFSRLVEFMRERLRKREEIEIANAYALKLKSKEQEIDDVLMFVRNLKAASTGSKKNIGTVIIGVLTAGITGAMAAWISKGGGHP